MKKDKSKSKSHETNIGKIIYGFLLFMPLIAIASAILINTFNMQTKERSEIHYRYETNELNSNIDIIDGNIYRFYYKELKANTDFVLFELNSQNEIDTYSYLYLTPINYTEIGFNNYINNDIEELSSPLYENQIEFRAYYNHDTYEYNIDNKVYYGWYDNICYYEYNDITTEFDLTVFYNNNFQDYIDVKFEYESDNTNIILNRDLYKYLRPIPKNEIPIDHVETYNLNAQDVFYDSINKVEESNLFNWAQNSIVYTTLTATCTALSINNTFIPLLLTYWLIISVIYILYDIALVMLMIFHRKVHELQECI